MSAPTFEGDETRTRTATLLNAILWVFITFFVSDNGIGIEKKFHEKVFGLFDKLDPQSEGTGVGLAHVKRIVEVYGGRIWVESEGEGKGSTFYFTLSTVEE